jgi:hypothetical protein
LFSLASAAAVTCGTMKPELTPPCSTRKGGSPESEASISSAMRRSESAPISAIDDRERVGDERHGLGVEVAAGEHFAGVGEHERVVGARRSPRLSSTRAA